MDDVVLAAGYIVVSVRVERQIVVEVFVAVSSTAETYPASPSARR